MSCTWWVVEIDTYHRKVVHEHQGGPQEWDNRLRKLANELAQLFVGICCLHMPIYHYCT